MKLFIVLQMIVYTHKGGILCPPHSAGWGLGRSPINPLLVVKRTEVNWCDNSTKRIVEIAERAGYYAIRSFIVSCVKSGVAFA